MKTPTDLSSGLAKLPQLKELDLDLRPHECVIPSSKANGLINRKRLGPKGFLSVKDNPNLQNVRLPFHAMIGYDRSPARAHYIPSPDEVLPSSLKSLTIRMDIEDLLKFLPRRFEHADAFDQPWEPRVAVVEFFEAIWNVGRDAFPHLREVVYLYSWTRQTYCRCTRDAKPSSSCEYWSRSKYSRHGTHGGQVGGYGDQDANVSPYSGLPTPPLSLESVLDEHGVKTNVPDRFKALVNKFAVRGVELSVVKTEDRSMHPDSFHFPREVGIQRWNLMRSASR